MQNLDFFSKILLEILQFSEIFLEFSEIKSSFGAIFAEIFTETEQVKKKIGFQLAKGHLQVFAGTGTTEAYLGCVFVRKTSHCKK